MSGAEIVGTAAAVREVPLRSPKDDRVKPSAGTAVSAIAPGGAMIAPPAQNVDGKGVGAPSSGRWRGRVVGASKPKPVTGTPNARTLPLALTPGAVASWHMSRAPDCAADASRPR